MGYRLDIGLTARKDMGYRSDIGLVLTKKANTKLEKKIKCLSANDAVRDGLVWLFETNNVRRFERENCVLYYWQNLKWYGEFEEIKFIDDFLESIRGNEYHFVRIGEENGDISEQGDLNDPFELFARTRMNISLGQDTWFLTDGYREYRVGLDFKERVPRSKMTRQEKKKQKKIVVSALVNGLKEEMEKDELL